MGFLAAVRNRWWLVVLCALLAPAVAYGVSQLQDERYSATASVLLSDPNVDRRKDEVVLPPTDPARSAETNVDLLRLDRVAAIASRNLSLERTPAQLEDDVDVASRPNSDLVSVTATESSPNSAALVANVFAQAYVRFRKSLENVRAGGAKVVERAEPPDSASSPKVLFNTLIGAFLGLPLGLGLALLIDRLDRRVRYTPELEQALDLPLLGVIPQDRTLATPGNPLAGLPAAATEPLRMVRAGLRYLAADRELKSFLITSATPGEGKSTVAYGLAAVSAGAGARTLLIEADLRRPSLSSITGVSAAAGLSSVLVGDFALDQASVDVAVGDDGGAPEGLGFSALLSGPIPPNPGELLESEAMKRLLKAARARFDVVFVDAPPVAMIADAISLLDGVDGVLVVTRLGSSKRETVEELGAQLRQLSAPLVGAIANFGPKPEADYYRYLYGGPAPTLAASARVPAQTDGRLSVNSVTYEQLRDLELKPAQALIILEYREQIGGYSSLDQLEDLPGIDAADAANLKASLTV